MNIKYVWKFDSSVEGWTGNNVQFEDSGGGMPSPHIYGSASEYSSSNSITFPVTFKSPRSLNITAGDYITFIFSGDGTVSGLTSKSVPSVTVEFVDASENVIDSITLPNSYTGINTALVALVRVPSDCVGFNVKVNVRTSGYTGKTHTHYARLDNVIVFNTPNEIFYSVLPSTLQITTTTEVQLSQSGSYTIISTRFDDIQNFTSYDESLTYDSSSTLNYGKSTHKLTTSSSSVDKISISHNADSTLGVYYTCEHGVLLLDPNTLNPEWFGSIKFYHNQNITNPDSVTFNITLDGTTPYSGTQSMSLKFTADGIFSVRLTPSAQITGDTSNVTQLTATITVKDSGGNTIDSMTYDILADSYDKQVLIDKSYDGQDLTIDITINANGTVSQTVTVVLNLLFEFIKT